MVSGANTAVTTQDPRPHPNGPCGDDHECGLRAILDRVGDKWSVLLIVELAKGPCRFARLQRCIPGISQRMLTLSVRRLERDGMVERTVYPTNPPQVDYRLTGLGRRLAGLIATMADWSRDHTGQISAARRAWDAANPEN